MPTYSEIFVRSPRIITVSGSANDATKVELFIWNDPSSQPASATYTLEKPIQLSGAPFFSFCKILFVF